MTIFMDARAHGSIGNSPSTFWTDGQIASSSAGTLAGLHSREAGHKNVSEELIRLYGVSPGTVGVFEAGFGENVVSISTYGKQNIPVELKSQQEIVTARSAVGATLNFKLADTHNLVLVDLK